ncbi:Unknown protein [Striga hermonthica]|uniref:Transmembrane protein n=1 Tax=Striga hermonthica TaxID=68872 RepID=A0A9N7MMN7_STRHE|nr:Unknown protein [Striga hermonthica]
MAQTHEDNVKEVFLSYTRSVFKRCGAGCWFVLFALSLLGGLMLAWWLLNYHSTNDEQWMVPFGLILFLSPLFVLMALFVSNFCDSQPENPFHGDPQR